MNNSFYVSFYCALILFKTTTTSSRACCMTYASSSATTSGTMTSSYFRVVISASSLWIKLRLKLFLYSLFSSCRWIWLRDSDLYWVLISIENYRAWHLSCTACSASHKCTVFLIAEEIQLSFYWGWNLLSCCSLCWSAILASICRLLYDLQIRGRFFTEKIRFLTRIFRWMRCFSLILCLLILVYRIVMSFVLSRCWMQIIRVVFSW